ncbi:MAG TPA: hypothetical protein VE954_41830, partial [Oligoflexus sp.]
MRLYRSLSVFLVASLTSLSGCDSSPKGNPSRSVARQNTNSADNQASTVDADRSMGAETPEQKDKDKVAAPIDDGPIVLPSTVTATARKGAADDDRTPPKTGGLILMGGGTDVDSSFVWAHDIIAGDKTTRRGDVLVLRATGADGYDQYIYDLAPFNSVQTLIIAPAAIPEHLDTVARLINRSEVIFFAGGNQADYVAWRNSKLMPAVQNVVTRGGVVG